HCVLFCRPIPLASVMVGFYRWEFWCHHLHADSRRGKRFIDGSFLPRIPSVAGFITLFCLVFFHNSPICRPVCSGAGSATPAHHELFGDLVPDDYCRSRNECYIS